MSRFATIVAAAALVAVATAVVAQATMPGKNGRIAFRRYFNDAHTSSGIFTIEADGSAEQTVTRSPAGYFDDQPDWAPDGSLLAFTRCPATNGPCAVYTVHPDGSGLRRLSKPCPKSAHETTCPDNANVAFSPDGRQIALTESSGHVKRDRLVDNIIERSAIVLVDRNGGHRREIVHSAPYAADFSWPQFSPDGRHIVYERANSSRSNPGGKRALFVVDVASGAQRRITAWALDDGDNPDWSPDGNWILFRSHVDDGQTSNVYVVHPNGSGLEQLTHFTKKGNVLTSSSFSPDGKQIVVGSEGVGGNADIYVMNADGSDLHPVTRTKLWDSAPDWGPTS
jgi:Tol biopolymer transport system component